MLIGVCALLLGAVFHTAGAYRSARDDHRPCTADGAAGPSRRVLAARSASTHDRMDSQHCRRGLYQRPVLGCPGLSIALGVTALVVVNGLPSLVVTVLHGRKVRS